MYKWKKLTIFQLKPQKLTTQDVQKDLPQREPTQSMKFINVVGQSFINSLG